MYEQVEKPKDNKSSKIANSAVQTKSNGKQGFGFVDNRPESIAQRKMQSQANISSLLPIQKKENNTGLPDNLKSGIENLSGYSMDDVKVHRNSNKPAQLQAHAYAQGTDIHLGAGQEKHLPHEAWHVVQQKQGRVKPTMQMKGMVNINNNFGLEKEANVMGGKAMHHRADSVQHTSKKVVNVQSNISQLMTTKKSQQGYNAIVFDLNIIKDTQGTPTFGLVGLEALLKNVQTLMNLNEFSTFSEVQELNKLGRGAYLTAGKVNRQTQLTVWPLDKIKIVSKINMALSNVSSDQAKQWPPENKTKITLEEANTLRYKQKNDKHGKCSNAALCGILEVTKEPLTPAEKIEFSTNNFQKLEPTIAILDRLGKPVKQTLDPLQPIKNQVPKDTEQKLIGFYIRQYIEKPPPMAGYGHAEFFYYDDTKVLWKTDAQTMSINQTADFQSKLVWKKVKDPTYTYVEADKAQPKNKNDPDVIVTYDEMIKVYKETANEKLNRHEEETQVRLESTAVRLVKILTKKKNDAETIAEFAGLGGKTNFTWLLEESRMGVEAKYDLLYKNPDIKPDQFTLQKSAKTLNKTQQKTIIRTLNKEQLMTIMLQKDIIWNHEKKEDILGDFLSVDQFKIVLSWHLVQTIYLSNIKAFAALPSHKLDAMLRKYINKIPHDIIQSLIIELGSKAKDYPDLMNKYNEAGTNEEKSNLLERSKEFNEHVTFNDHLALLWSEDKQVQKSALYTLVDNKDKKLKITTNQLKRILAGVDKKILPRFIEDASWRETINRPNVSDLLTIMSDEEKIRVLTEFLRDTQWVNKISVINLKEIMNGLSEEVKNAILEDQVSLKGAWFTMLTTVYRSEALMKGYYYTGGWKMTVSATNAPTTAKTLRVQYFGTDPKNLTGKEDWRKYKLNNEPLSFPSDTTQVTVSVGKDRTVEIVVNYLDLLISKKKTWTEEMKTYTSITNSIFKFEISLQNVESI